MFMTLMSISLSLDSIRSIENFSLFPSGLSTERERLNLSEAFHRNYEAEVVHRRLVAHQVQTLLADDVRALLRIRNLTSLDWLGPLNLREGLILNPLTL